MIEYVWDAWCYFLALSIHCALNGCDPMVHLLSLFLRMRKAALI